MFDSYLKGLKELRQEEDAYEKSVREYLSAMRSPDDLFVKAYRAWLSYFDQLEAFEQKICRARDANGVALRACGEEVRACNQKARLLRQELFEPLRALNIPHETENSARDLALREHQRKWKKR